MSPLQRHRHNMRREARRSLHGMVEAQKGKCHYCGSRIVCLSWLGDRVIDKDSRTCRFFERGEVITVRIASVEHLTRLADGGGNDDRNLVAACVRCNASRSNPPRQPRKCRGCGQPSGRRRRCEKCRLRKA